MTYHELVANVKDTLSAVDASAIAEHIAVQVNVLGEAEGIFYIEAAEGKLNVEPYDYVDRDALVAASEEAILALMAGELNAVQAMADGVIYFEGNADKMAMLNEVFAQLPVKKPAKKAAAKKPAAKKPAAKKPAAKKTTAKKAAAEAAPEAPAPAAAEAPAKRTRAKKSEAAAEKKPAAKKTAAKKTAKKTEEKTEA